MKKILKLKFKNTQRASLVAQLVKNLPPTWETWVQSLGLEDLEMGWQPTPVLLLGISHGQRNWWDTVHVVAESDATK